MENLSAADVAAVTRGGYGEGLGLGGAGGSGLWLFAILALMWGGVGGPFGRNGVVDARAATVEDLANQSNFTRLEDQVRANAQLTQATATNISNGLSSLGYEIASQFGITNRQMAECCCGINRNIDGVRYEGAINTAAINANVNAMGQKILDKLCQDREAALLQRINYLEMQTLIQPPRAIPAYTVANPYTGATGATA